ncbi:MAG: GAF domain-containing protein [Pseudomonadota bacterium]
MDEPARIRELLSLQVLDTPAEQRYDDIVRIAAGICGTPMALVSLVDDHRQWFKARIGLDAAQTARDIAFCARAIETPEALFVVPDAAQDPRFVDNPLVTSAPSLRFYAGVPLTTAPGLAVGTLCVLDTEPRELDAEQLDSLQALARQVSSQLQLGRATRELEARNEELSLFAYATSHDLQSPLKSLEGYLNLLQIELGEPAERIGDVMQRIQRTLLRMQEQTRSVALLAEADTRVETETVALEPLLNDACLDLAATSSLADLDLVVSELGEGEANAPLLRRAFVHVLAHFLRYEANGHTTQLSISAVRQRGELHLVFESPRAFSRMPSKGADDGPERELGVAILRRIVARHAGRLVVSRTDHRQRFTLILPQGGETVH